MKIQTLWDTTAHPTAVLKLWKLSVSRLSKDVKEPVFIYTDKFHCKLLCLLQETVWQNLLKLNTCVTYGPEIQHIGKYLIEMSTHVDLKQCHISCWHEGKLSERFRDSLPYRCRETCSTIFATFL